MKLNGKTLIKFGVSIGLLAFFLTTTGIQKTFQELASANLWYLPVGVLVYLFSQVISSYRWRLLAQPLRFDLTFRQFYEYYLMGMFFSLFLPGSIGGDVSRMYYLAKTADRKKREALLTILAERGMGFAALVFITGIICLTPMSQPIPESIRITVLALCIGGFFGVVVMRLVPLQPLVSRFPKLSLLEQADVYFKSTRTLLQSFLMSMMVHGFMLVIHLMIAQALNINISPSYLMAVYGIVSLASVIPISFNGIGVREGAYIALLAKVGIPSHTGLAFSLYWFLISSVTSLLGGLVLLKGHYKTPSAQDVELAQN